jgi:outer membrane receptor protein involved in Fe transport
MARFPTGCSFVVVSLLALAGIAAAQATAQLNGRVTDESGGVLPGVTVTATQTDTGFVRAVVSDESGAWAMPNLPTGPYRLEVSLPGFRTYVQTGIVLQVGTSPVINASLGVGGLEESVTVEAAAPLVDVRSSGLNEVVEQERIVELPLQGRQVTDLVVLAGSAVNTGVVLNSLNRKSGVAISVAGGLRTGTAYTLDGAMHTDMFDHLNLPFPFPDALQEFGVATGGLSAETGMFSGASVNAVTKSGTNSFHGNAFEFLRDRRFNATSPFAAVGADGQKKDDGLNRNQFGGTLGGPVVRDRLFFFGGYQRTRARQLTADNVAFVPTAAALAGDFTALASPACNGGRQVNLAAPFAANRINPALLHPAAIRVMNSGLIPASADPCGEIRYSVPLDDNDEQYVVKVDYQISGNHSMFGRYINDFERRPGTLGRTGNLLAIANVNRPANFKHAQIAAYGLTQVLGQDAVNAFRATMLRANNTNNVPPETFFDAPSLGINAYSYVPGVMALSVTNAFAFSGGGSVGAWNTNKAYQVGDDFTLVRGRHQLGIGANVLRQKLDAVDNARAVGQFNFTGRATGLALADFLTGRMSGFIHGAPGILDNHQWYVGAYAADTWRATDRVTLNVGLRWEPYFGTYADNGAISNFVLENYRQGIRSTVFHNAPPGLTYPGDPGFVSNTGLDKQWANFSPRVGVAWDVTGDGTTALRSSYAINYDFPTLVSQQIAAQAAPWNNRIDFTNDMVFDDPYRGVPGGQLHPVQLPPPADVRYPSFGSYAAMDPGINSTRVQSWNLTVERQIATAWQVSGSYIGTYTDRLWGSVALNPGVFLGLGPCNLHGIAYPVCSTTANLEQRRALRLENPAFGDALAYVSEYTDIGEKTYHGLKLSFRRRAADSLSLSGNYTLSRCETDTEVSGGFTQFTSTYTNPEAPTYDRGNCGSNRTHIANLTAGYLTPQFGNAMLRVLASDWRMSGMLEARSGAWLTVTTTADRAFSGIPGQRVDQLSDDPYGDRTLTNYLDAAAFALPALGTLGNHVRNSVEGPGFWQINLALARLLRVREAQTLELRIEAFNLFNNFNWGNPVTNFNAGTFGRITTAAGDPRIMQFAVKYGF